MSEMLGHSRTLVTHHYPGGMNLDETFDTNNDLFKLCKDYRKVMAYTVKIQGPI